MTDFKATDEAVLAAARTLCAINSRICGIDEQDNWKLYSDHFKADAKAAIEAALPVMFEERAHLRPHIVSFNSVERTSCPAHILSVIEGNVAWSAEVGCGDSGGVIDKHGVHHRPIPLYATKEPK